MSCCGRNAARTANVRSKNRSAACLAAIVAMLTFAGGPLARAEAVLSSGEYSDCTPSTSALVFDGGYSVSLCYETAEGLVGEGRAGIWASGESGLMWFFSRENAEMLVKVLNGCAHNGYRWAFVAPVTDVAFNLQSRAAAATLGSTGTDWVRPRRPGATSRRSDARRTTPTGRI